MRLENWSLTHGLYQAPEQGCHLIGNVYGHPTRPDGRRVRTSTVVRIDRITETIETRSGSIYELGEVDPDYERMFPDARKRVFHTILEPVGKISWDEASEEVLSEHAELWEKLAEI